MGRGNQSSGSGGYGKPPKHTQFKPGQSGNPRGRPKKPRTLRDALDAELKNVVEVKLNGEMVRLTGAEAVIKRIFHGAAQGDPAMIRILMKEAHGLGESVQEFEALPGDEQALADLLKRGLGGEDEQE